MLFFLKATKVGSPPNFQMLISQLRGIPQPQYFVTSLLEQHWTYFWKHYIYHKKDTKVGSQNLAPNLVLYQTEYGDKPQSKPMMTEIVMTYHDFFSIVGGCKHY